MIIFTFLIATGTGFIFSTCSTAVEEEEIECENGMNTGELFDSDSPFFNKRCLCNAGWTGENCATSLRNQCGNNGQLKPDGNCKCAQNYTGANCDKVLHCDHGELQKTRGICVCRFGWRGDFCHRIICEYGDVVSEENQTCACGKRFSGQHCSFCADNDAETPPPECRKRKQPISDSSAFGWSSKHAIIKYLLIAAGICVCVFVVFTARRFFLQNSAAHTSQPTASADAEQPPVTVMRPEKQTLISAASLGVASQQKKLASSSNAHQEQRKLSTALWISLA